MKHDNDDIDHLLYEGHRRYRARRPIDPAVIVWILGMVILGIIVGVSL